MYICIHFLIVGNKFSEAKIHLTIFLIKVKSANQTAMLKFWNYNLQYKDRLFWYLYKMKCRQENSLWFLEICFHKHAKLYAYNRNIATPYCAEVLMWAEMFKTVCTGLSGAIAHTVKALRVVCSKPRQQCHSFTVQC